MKKATKLLFIPMVSLLLTGFDFLDKLKKENNENETQQQEQPTISLNKPSLVFKVGESEKLVATVAKGEGGVTWTSSNTNAATVDAEGLVTAVAKGVATITATYSGKTATCSVTVKGTDDLYALSQVSDNENIKTFKLNVQSDEFRGDTSAVLEVGLENPIDVKPVMKILDLETMQDAPQSVWDFEYKCSLQKYNETSHEYEDTDVEYMEFDSANCTVDFKDNALDGQFKLSILPGGLTAEEEALYKKELEVKVFNGYNVYTPNELAYFNDINFDTVYRQNDTETRDINGSWKKFRRDHGLDENKVASSIYLQSDIVIRKENLPEVFFYTEAQAQEVGHPEWAGHMIDESDLYVHYADNFTFNGNYFHIDTQYIPLGEDTGSYGDFVSHSTLFKVCEAGSAVSLTEKNLVFKNCSYYGNSPRAEDKEGGEVSEESMGLIFFKVRNGGNADNNILVKSRFENFNVARACLSFYGEYGLNDLTIKDCYVHEGYSNGMYLYRNGDVHFINSKFENFGGGILQLTGKTEYTKTGFHIDADADTVLENYVTANEPWFVHTAGGIPQTALTNFKAFDAVVQGLSAAFASDTKFKKSFITSSNGAELMNVIIINYGATPYYTFKKANANQIGFDKNDANLAQYEGFLSSGLFMFQTDDGGLATHTGSPSADPTPYAYTFNGNYMALNCVQGGMNAGVVYGLHRV